MPFCPLCVPTAARRRHRDQSCPFQAARRFRSAGFCWVLPPWPPGQAAAGGAPSITLQPMQWDPHSVNELTVPLESMGPFINPLLIND